MTTITYFIVNNMIQTTIIKTEHLTASI